MIGNRSSYIYVLISLYSSNERRLKEFDKSISVRSRQYRAKRININVKINSLAYIVEVLGGVIMGGLALVPPATFLYLGTQMWYGNIIPSCYLINSSDIKDYIMDNGWWNGFSRIYSKRNSKDELRKNSKGNSEDCKRKKNISTKSRVFPEPSSSDSKGTNNGKKDRENDKHNDIHHSIQNKKNDKLNKAVILHDLEGIQTCQHVDVDIQIHQRKSKTTDH